jgi:hypothetical protein
MTNHTFNIRQISNETSHSLKMMETLPGINTVNPLRVLSHDTEY